MDVFFKHQVSFCSNQLRIVLLRLQVCKIVNIIAQKFPHRATNKGLSYLILEPSIYTMNSFLHEKEENESDYLQEVIRLLVKMKRMIRLFNRWILTNDIRPCQTVDMIESRDFMMIRFRVKSLFLRLKSI